MRIETWFVGFLAAAAAASPLGSTPGVTLEQRQIGIVSAQQVGQFRIYAEYAAATYCNGENSPGQVISCSGDACNQVTANRPTTVATFSGLLTGIQGFVATDPVRREIILAIRGSANVRNWVTNFRLISTPCDFVFLCRVHSGFNSAWNEIRNQAQAAVAQARAANPSYRVVVTGHSLGGAVATIAGASLRASGTPAELYTYASPRVGNEQFARFVSNQPGGHYRVTHGADPVPKVPPFVVGYRHTTPEYWLNGGSSTTINYSPASIKVCTGTLTFGCNNGLDIPDVTAHSYYLNNMSGCSPGGFEVRLPGEEEGELEEAFDRMIEMDREYIEKNETPKNSTMTV